MKQKHKLQMIGMVFAVSVLTGCEDSQVKDLNAYVQDIRQKEGAASQKISEPELKPPAAATYHPDSVRTPFAKSEATRANKGVFSNPLLAYPITMLRFVGTVTQDKKTFAYVAAPDGKIYQVKQGDRMGDQKGQVVSITQERLNVTEQVSEGGRQTASRVVTLQLREENE